MKQFPRILPALFAAMLLAACAEQAAPPPPLTIARIDAPPLDPPDAFVRPVAAERRIHAVPGRPIVFPIRPATRDVPFLMSHPWSLTDHNADAAHASIPPAVTVAIASGRDLDASVHWIEAVARPAGDGSAAWTWNAWTREQAMREPRRLRPGGGFWVVRVPPLDEPANLTMDDRPLPIVWLEADVNVLPMPGASEVTADLESRLRPWRQDPRTQWLAARMIGRSIATPNDADDVLDDLASLIDARWTRALAHLAEIDPDLAQRVSARLALVVAMPADPPDIEPTLVPAPPDATIGGGDAQWDLLDTLLREDASPGMRRDAASAWLEAAPSAAAWIVDDFPNGAADRVLACVVNLRAERAALAVAAGQRAPDEAGWAPAHGARLVEVATPADAARDGMTDVSITVDDRVFRLRALTGRLPVTPPGLRMGPFLTARTGSSLTRRTPASPPVDRMTAALAQRALDGDDWEIYLECAGPPTIDGADRVTLAFGPRGDERCIIDVAADGVASIERDGRTQTYENVTFGGGPGYWSAAVRVPDDILSDDGAFLLGMTRRDRDGLVTSWPRAMHPGQRLPGRALIDTTFWRPLLTD